MLAARKEAWDQMRAGQGEQHPLTAEVGIEYATALAERGAMRMRGRSRSR